MTMYRSIGRVFGGMSVAASLALSAVAFAQGEIAPPAAGQGAPAEMPQFEIPKVADISGDFTDAMKTPEAVKAAEEALKKTAKSYADAK